MAALADPQGNQTFFDFVDKEELGAMKSNFMLDWHVQKFSKASTTILGFTVQGAKLWDECTPDFYQSMHLQDGSTEIDLSQQLEWLSKELQITQTQISQYSNQLKSNIEEVSKKEEAEAESIQDKNGSLLKYIIGSIIALETKQLAESIMRIKAQRDATNSMEEASKPNLFGKKKPSQTAGRKKTNEKEFLLEFDPSLNLNDLWVTQDDLTCFNELRSEMDLSIRQPQVLMVNEEKTTKNKKVRVQEQICEKEMGFCHHCKQIKTTYIMASCNYQSQVHGLLLPISFQANSFSNVGPHNSEISNGGITRKIFQDKKKLKSHEETIEYACKKQFCVFCLKNYYQILLQDAQKDKSWLCPCCQSICCCSRCMRQEQIQLKLGQYNQKQDVSGGQQQQQSIGIPNTSSHELTKEILLDLFRGKVDPQVPNSQSKCVPKGARQVKTRVTSDQSLLGQSCENLQSVGIFGPANGPNPFFAEAYSLNGPNESQSQLCFLRLAQMSIFKNKQLPYPLTESKYNIADQYYHEKVDEIKLLKREAKAHTDTLVSKIKEVAFNRKKREVKERGKAKIKLSKLTSMDSIFLEKDISSPTLYLSTGGSNTTTDTASMSTKNTESGKRFVNQTLKTQKKPLRSSAVSTCKAKQTRPARKGQLINGFQL